MITNPHQQDITWRLLELLAAFVLAASAAGLLAARLGVFHAVPIWIIAGLCTFGYAGWLSRAKPLSSGALVVPLWHLVLVVGIALLFRYEPYNYLLGGQDQGVYANMAAYLMRTGGLEPIDPIIAKITNPEVLQAYRQTNYGNGHYLPGIYTVADGLEFQFYHLFPIWLGLFAGVIGVEHMGYATVFLSLVSLLFLQRLATLVSGNAVAGLVAGLLLAVSPLHAFFSKFPVTEVPTLAFSAICFTYLSTYWRAEDESRMRYLVLALCAISAVFMTRISGFMYMPVIVGILFLALLLDPASPKRRALLIWAVIAVLLYAASVLYGLKWSHQYTTAIYELSFAPLLGPRWKTLIALIVVVMVMGLLLLAWLCRRPQHRLLLGRLPGLAAWCFPIIVSLATVIALWHAYRLGFTDVYADHPRYGNNGFKLAGKGLKSVGSVSLIAAALYLSPFMLLGFLMTVWKRPISIAVGVLMLLVCAFYTHVAAIQWILPYQPYYARYLISEFVPYLTVFVVVAWAVSEAGVRRLLLTTILILSGLWTAYLSVAQIGKNEHEGVARSLNRIASHVDAKDLVLIERSMRGPLGHEVKMPLLHVHGLNVVSVDPKDVEQSGYAHRLAKQYRDIFYLTTNTMSPDGFSEVDSIDFLERHYCHSTVPPTELCVRSDSRLLLYKRIKAPPPTDGDPILQLQATDEAILTKVGEVNGSHLVSTGQAGYMIYGPYKPLAAGRYTLVLRGSSSTPFTLDIAANKGEKVYVRTRLPHGQDAPNQVLLSTDFAVNEAVSDLEVRVVVPDGSDIRIAGYDILYRTPLPPSD